MDALPIDTQRVQETDENRIGGDGRLPYVVGIGASAGGLEALERFFENMPVRTGMVFVVVQHLSPDFKSLMDELLARKTEIPIHRASDGMEVEPDAIYLIPPKKDMIIANGRLLLTDKDPTQLVTLPIDHFFRSLAHDLGDRAIAIVLSGTGSDGSRGVREVHEAGGLVIVQTPETAKFDGMPNSARQTATVDLILAPEEMPAALLQYIKHPDAAPSDGDRLNQAPPLPEQGLDAIFRMLRDANGIDFSHYKSSTVSRRIERRLLLNRSFEIDDYANRLREDPVELNALYLDLLIGVTRFFRDADAFEQLGRQILPGLLADLPRDEDLRVWVAGCATGEEAYSLAILINEQAEAVGRPVKVKVFATDVHRASLDYASAGVYTKAQVADVNQERLQRYFIPKGDCFQVAHELRQMVVFAPHNLIKDAPFTKLDLITCRNLLIYLQPAVQKKALSLFHFGLKTGGCLFLGPSETPGELSDEFLAVDAHWKIYRKRRDIRLPADLRLPLSASAPHWVASTRGGRSLPPRLGEQQLAGTYDALLEECMPTSLLVNEHHELVQTFAGGNRYLHLKEGRLSTDVYDLVSPDLRIVLSGALPRVFHERTPITYRGLRVNLPGGERMINLTVKPVTSARSNVMHALVVLEDQGGAPAPLSVTEVNLDRASREQYHMMESELRFTKENLQATIEELETSNEELQATNEELVASNEELQSTNEELHSVNEELYTVNAEYQKKISELTQVTSDMDNLLESTQVHTLFLDRNLCIRKFTPLIAETFHLVPQDIGRRIDSFTHNIDFPALSEELAKVMSNAQAMEQQVRDHHGNWFLLRILPYQGKDGIDGCVLTLIDINRLKRAEQQTREAVEQRDRFLAMLSHELRNPLGAMVSATQVLDRSSTGLPGQAEAVHVLKRQQTQMGRLLDDLLDIARVTQDKIQLHRSLVNLRELIEEAVRVVQPAFDSPGLLLDVRHADEPLIVNGDFARLQQMVVNLLLNGAKYTPAGGCVRLEVAKENDEAVIRVRDNGVGIRPEMLEKVFELFVQADDNLHRSGSGLGVGLTLVRRIAELHGGRVRASSAGPGQGSEFAIRLPLAAATDSDLLAPEPPKPALRKPIKIVLVEDNDDSRRMLETVLQLDGHDVTVCRDGEEGLAAIRAHRPQLAIVDVGLPNLDGYELARRARASHTGQNVYLVALTGYGQEEDRRKVLQAGFDEHLVKPLKIGELERILARLAVKPQTA
jgi:chemotaxis methyl-accepting protein methylase/signal transduction histidine kinase/chemotaxis response regulator CheB